MLLRADSVRKPSETSASPKKLRSTAGLARRVTAVDKQLWTALYSGFMALERLWEFSLHMHAHCKNRFVIILTDSYVTSKLATQGMQENLIL